MTENGPLVLLYHRVGTPRMRSKASRHYVSARAFAWQIAALQKTGFGVVGLDAVARHLRGEEPLTDRHVALTFDDGVGPLYPNAFPTLQRFGCPATIFLISRYLGMPSDYDPPDWDRETLLTEAQILEMQAGGVTFGSHTRHHALLTSCTESELTDELAGAKHDLEELLGRPVPSFCYPYGAQNPAVRGAVARAGYEFACSTLKGRNDQGVDPFLIRRISIRADTSPPIFLYKLARARYANR